ncbi:ribonuclease H-like domain-containing protein [Ustulina deusta]|nr:ribonuclease H-like domain-containing protein [Ustulina deusta]
MEAKHSCSDCHLLFPSKKTRVDHALSTGHMNDRTCVDCRAVFATATGLRQHKTQHKNHQPEGAVSAPATNPGTEALRSPSQSGHAETATPTPHQSHFSPTWWRDGSDVDAALQQRPNHGYPWASPALTDGVYALLRASLLDGARRKSERFPSRSPHEGPTNNVSFNPFADNHPRHPPKPSNRRRGPVYAALVIDCEMVELQDHVQDLVSVAAVDFLSGAVVLNTLVQPTGVVKDWRTRVTGVSPAVLRAAKQQHGNDSGSGNGSGSGSGSGSATVLRGWRAARDKIFAMTDANTVFVGHALPNDLRILRIAADHVVDSVVLTARAAFADGGPDARFPRRWGLGIACRELVGVDVQTGRAHDALEDALATRELVIWCLTHPAGLLAWGAEARVTYEREAEARRERQKAEARRKAEERKRLAEEEEEEKKKKLEGERAGDAESPENPAR